MALLEVKDLSLHYRQDRKVIRAVNHVSLKVQEGEALGIVGESGCGKSTLAKALIRLLPESAVIDGGEILFRDQDIMAMTREELRKIRGKGIGMIFQNPMTALNPIIKLKDQIYEVLEGQGLSRQEMWNRAVELYQMVGIPAPERRLNEYIHQYSGGMRQRAMIAIVLASRPGLLIADEPTTALDVTIQKQIIELLKRLCREMHMAIILITHDIAVVNEICDRVAVMYGGRLVETGDREEIFGRALHPYTKGLMESLPGSETAGRKLKVIEGMPPDLSEEIKGCVFADRCAYVKACCRETEMQMREVREGHQVACMYPDRK